MPIGGLLRDHAGKELQIFEKISIEPVLSLY